MACLVLTKSRSGQSLIVVLGFCLSLLALSCDKAKEGDKKPKDPATENGQDGPQKEPPAQNPPSDSDSTSDTGPAPGSGSNPDQTPAPGSDPAKVCNITLVSDLDDTIKQTNVLDKTDMVRKTFSKPLPFSSLNIVYQRLAICPTADLRLEIVSSSPSLLKTKVEDFLKKYAFPKSRLHLREAADMLDSMKYKTETIDKIIADRKGEQFILIGDDTENDPAIYETIAKKYPDRVLAVYIHRVKAADTALPAGQLSFHTALDLALQEVKAQRLTQNDALQTVDALLKEKDLATVIPDFAACPAAKLSCEGASDATLTERCNAFATQLEEFCAKK